MKRKKIALIAVTTLLVLSLLIIPTACSSKSSSDTEASTTQATPIQQVTNRVSSLESRLSAVENKLGTMSNPDYAVDIAAVQDELANLSADIAALATNITSLEGQLAVVQTTITGYQETLTDYEDRLDELEEPSSSARSTDPEDAIEVSLTYPPSAVIPAVTTSLTATKSVSVSVPVRLKLDNTLTVGIDDIELYATVRLTPDVAVPYIFKVEMAGDIVWQSYGGSPPTYTFTNWDFPKLKAGERKAYNMLLTITLVATATDPETTYPAGNIGVSIRITPEDFEEAG